MINSLTSSWLLFCSMRAPGHSCDNLPSDWNSDTSTVYGYLLFSKSVFLGTFLGDRLEELFKNQAEFTQFCARFMANTFPLCDPYNTSIGTAFSPPLALLNHSCVPNTNFVMPNYPSASNKEYISLIAYQDIKPGEAITTCYVSPLRPGHQRRGSLLIDHEFECNCPLCIRELNDTTWIDPLRALVCNVKYCKGLLPMPRES